MTACSTESSKPRLHHFSDSTVSSAIRRRDTIDQFFTQRGRTLYRSRSSLPGSSRAPQEGLDRGPSLRSRCSLSGKGGLSFAHPLPPEVPRRMSFQSQSSGTESWPKKVSGPHKPSASLLGRLPPPYTKQAPAPPSMRPPQGELSSRSFAPSAVVGSDDETCVSEGKARQKNALKQVYKSLKTYDITKANVVDLAKEDFDDNDLTTLGSYQSLSKPSQQVVNDVESKAALYGQSRSLSALSQLGSDARGDKKAPSTQKLGKPQQGDLPRKTKPVATLPQGPPSESDARQTSGATQSQPSGAQKLHVRGSQGVPVSSVSRSEAVKPLKHRPSVQRSSHPVHVGSKQEGLNKTPKPTAADKRTITSTTTETPSNRLLSTNKARKFKFVADPGRIAKRLGAVNVLLDPKPASGPKKDPANQLSSDSLRTLPKVEPAPEQVLDASEFMTPMSHPPGGRLPCDDSQESLQADSTPRALVTESLNGLWKPESLSELDIPEKDLSSLFSAKKPSVEEPEAKLDHQQALVSELRETPLSSRAPATPATLPQLNNKAVRPSLKVPTPPMASFQVQQPVDSERTNDDSKIPHQSVEMEANNLQSEAPGLNSELPANSYQTQGHQLPPVFVSAAEKSIDSVAPPSVTVAGRLSSDHLLEAVEHQELSKSSRSVESGNLYKQPAKASEVLPACAGAKSEVLRPLNPGTDLKAVVTPEKLLERKEGLKSSAHGRRLIAKEFLGDRHEEIISHQIGREPGRLTDESEAYLGETVSAQEETTTSSEASLKHHVSQGSGGLLTSKFDGDSEAADEKWPSSLMEVENGSSQGGSAEVMGLTKVNPPSKMSTQQGPSCDNSTTSIPSRIAPWVASNASEQPVQESWKGHVDRTKSARQDSSSSSVRTSSNEWLGTLTSEAQISLAETNTSSNTQSSSLEEENIPPPPEISATPTTLLLTSPKSPSKTTNVAHLRELFEKTSKTKSA